MSDSVHVAFLYLSVSLSFSFSSSPPPLSWIFLYMIVCADGIRGGLSGLGDSAGIDRTVPASPQVAGKYEKIGGGGAAKYSVTMSCAFVVPMGFVCNMGIFLLETQNKGKKTESWLDFSPAIAASHFIFSRFVTGHAVLLVGVKLQFRPDCENKSFCEAECAQEKLTTLKALYL